MPKYLSEKEQYCLDILEGSGQPQRVINHCKAVANEAKKLATALNKKGAKLDISLCYRAALLHDVCRTQKQHAKKGKQYLENLGLYPEADIVAKHMGEGLNTDELSEACVVCLADKLIAGGENVSIKDRFAPSFNRYADDPEMLATINKRYETALKLKALVDNLLEAPE